MGIILIGIILIVVILILSSRFEWDGSIIAPLCLIIFLTSLLMGILMNTGGYRPIQEVKTYELQNLADRITSSGGGSVFYVSIGAENTYTFYTEVDSVFKTDESRAYVSKTVSGKGDVTIIEEKMCENPRMTVYYREPIATFWSFGEEGGITFYVFYVPEGTIVHEYALGQK